MGHKGIHDIPTARTALNRRTDNSRASTMAELARLEQEKARHARGMKIQLMLMKETERRMSSVDQQIERLECILAESTDGDRSAGRIARPVAGMRQTNAIGQDSTAWRTITLEY